MGATIDSEFCSDGEGGSGSIDAVRSMDDGDAVCKIAQPSGSRKQSFPI